MKRGDIFRIYKGSSGDAKNFRLFVIISRQVLIESKHSTIICTPIYSSYNNLSTQVLLNEDDGMKGVCSIHCDELISVPKSKITDFISSLKSQKLINLNQSLAIAIGIS